MTLTELIDQLQMLVARRKGDQITYVLCPDCGAISTVDTTTMNPDGDVLIEGEFLETEQPTP